MAGKIKNLIDTIVTSKSGGNPTLASVTRTKLILKGINPEKFTAQSEDDPSVINKLKEVASEMGINL